MTHIEEVKTRAQRRQFVQFPLKLYKGNAFFVPPLYADEMKIFKKNYSYNEQAEAVYYLAYREKEVVGRISGILQRVANEKWKQKRVRFTRFDSINDQEVTNALFGAVESWAKSKGMTEVVGPLGFSDLEREGLLIEGFDELATFEEQYNFDYYQKLIENLGYQKEVDWVEHKLYLPKERDARLPRLSQKILERFELHMSSAKSTREFIKKYADKFFEVLDQSYAEIYGTVPFTDRMKKELIANFNLVIDLRFVRVILDKNDRPVCFGLCFPSLAKAVQKSGGRLTLPALFRVLKAVKRPKIIDLALIGVVEEYRMKGVGSVLINELINMLDEKGVEYCETNLNLEENYNILNMWKSFESVQHKRRRSYIKQI